MRRGYMPDGALAARAANAGNDSTVLSGSEPTLLFSRKRNPDGTIRPKETPEQKAAIQARAQARNGRQLDRDDFGSSKDYDLPCLDKGIDLPCFALTGPYAGSDATALVVSRHQARSVAFGGSEANAYELAPKDPQPNSDEKPYQHFQKLSIFFH